ncbi:MAG: hypothetical protein SFU25_08775, partial [Candidatus Caenarcaniphilales bacterium]|nr:hypothetical protein [Candidatus Caenarcaniphilales bacterium]
KITDPIQRRNLAMQNFLESISCILGISKFNEQELFSHLFAFRVSSFLKENNGIGKISLQNNSRRFYHGKPNNSRSSEEVLIDLYKAIILADKQESKILGQQGDLKSSMVPREHRKLILLEDGMQNYLVFEGSGNPLCKKTGTGTLNKTNLYLLQNPTQAELDRKSGYDASLPEAVIVSNQLDRLPDGADPRLRLIRLFQGLQLGESVPDDVSIDFTTDKATINFQN